MVKPEIVRASRSTSVSFGNKAPLAVTPCNTVISSFAASGASFTFVTEMVNVAVVVRPLGSLAV